MCGCDNRINSDNHKKFYLDDEYYNKPFLKKIDSDKLIELENNGKSFVILTHIPGACNNDVPFAPLVNDFISKYKVKFYEINFKEINGTQIDKYVKYAPSLVIYEDGKLIAYMDANSDSDLKYYESLDGLYEWLSKYIYFK